MALPGFRNHPKFRRLVSILRMPEPYVLGHVEMLWEVVYESGSAILGDSVDVELAAQWAGEPGAFCQALVSCGGTTRAGLIDEIEPGVFQVHDLEDHAPNYVNNRRRRVEEKGKDKECAHCGTTFRTADSRSKFCSDSCRKQAWRDAKKGVNTGCDASATDVRRSGDASATHGTDRPITTSPAQPSTDKEEANASPLSGGEVTPLFPLEPKPEALAPKIVTSLPCIGSGPKLWDVTEQHLDDWARAFPAVNVRQEVEHMRVWLDANPTNRKTHSGMGRFAVSWLGRTQDRARTQAAPSTPRSFSRATQADADFIAQLEALEPGA